MEPDERGRIHITIEPLDGTAEESTGETLTYVYPQPDSNRSISDSPPNLPEVIVEIPTRMGRGSVAETAGAGARLAGIRRGIVGLTDRVQAAISNYALTLETVLFGLAVIVYLLVRLIGVQDFPIYFFTDEAVQTILAADLVRDNFFGYEKEFLPTFFKNGAQFNLSLSVYAQVLPYLLFGKSVLVTRITAVLITIMAPLAVGLTLRDFFKMRYWWAGALLLSIAPAWFLHSRTAFETTLATSFYAVFLYFYLLYRYESARNLYRALVVAALMFYSYSPAQIVIGVTGALLLISDFRYHWQNRRIGLRALGLGILLSLPYLRFRLAHLLAPVEHLRILGSYWLEPIPLQEKFTRYFGEYFFGLSPGYWFVPNERDLSRHVMKGYGHLIRATLPLGLIGLVLCLERLRSSAHRTLLIAFLAAPSGAALVQMAVTRALTFVIPATLLISLGLAQVLSWLERLRIPRRGLAVGVFGALSFFNFYMLSDALNHGPTWFGDYGLGGLQYGGRQVFSTIRQILERSAETEIVLSPNWANGTDVLARFFLWDPLPIQMASVEDYLDASRPLNEDTLLVLPSDEYAQIAASNKFTGVEVQKIIPYPDGRPGFYFIHLQYVDNIEAILVDEELERVKLVEEEFELDGSVVQIKHSRLDIGRIADMFDGDDQTVARSHEVNPMVIEFSFPKPRRLGGISMITGSAHAEISAWLFREPGGVPAMYKTVHMGSEEAPVSSVDFGETQEVRALRIEVLDRRQDAFGHVHVWELRLR